MSLYKGTDNINDLYTSSNIYQVYKGHQLVWQKTQPLERKLYVYAITHNDPDVETEGNGAYLLNYSQSGIIIYGDSMGEPETSKIRSMSGELGKTGSLLNGRYPYIGDINVENCGKFHIYRSDKNIGVYKNQTYFVFENSVVGNYYIQQDSWNDLGQYTFTNEELLQYFVHPITLNGLNLSYYIPNGTKTVGNPYLLNATINSLTPIGYITPEKRYSES